MRHKGRLGIIIILLMVIGCGDASRKNAEDFFPLKQDITWKYEVTVFDGSGNIKEKREGTVCNLAKVTLANNIATPQKFSFETINSQHQASKISSTEYISQDNDGIFLLGLQKEGEDIPRVGMWLYYILNPIKVGVTKKYSNNDIYRSVSVDSINDIVNVPAGTFKDCLKVNITTKDETGLYQNTSWYAPNIGRIKTIVVFLNNDKMVSQLISYKK